MDTVPSPPDVDHQHAEFADGITLDCGQTLDGFSLAYRTYGTLNAAEVQLHPGVPRADRRPVRGGDAAGDRQARLVGTVDGRARPA